MLGERLVDVLNSSLDELEKYIKCCNQTDAIDMGAKVAALFTRVEKYKEVINARVSTNLGLGFMSGKHCTVSRIEYDKTTLDIKALKAGLKPKVWLPYEVTQHIAYLQYKPR